MREQVSEELANLALRRLMRPMVFGPSRMARESFAASQYERAPTLQTQRYWLNQMAEAACVEHAGPDEWA